MSEYVASLELQIKDNADTAAKGLTKLADTFRRIKSSISEGFGEGLEKAATQLTTFNQQISGLTREDNVTRLNNLASALERICNATKGMKSVRGLTNAVRQVASGSPDLAGLAGAKGKTGDIRRGVADFRSEFESMASAANNVRRMARAAGHRMESALSINAARVIPRGTGLGSGSSELSTYVMGRARADAHRIAAESIPRITDGMERAKDFADQFGRARTEAEHVRRITEKTFRATDHVQRGTGRHGSGTYNWLDDASEKNGALSAARLRYEADKMFQAGEFGSQMWRRLYEEIGSVNWKDALGPSGKAVGRGEAEDWIRGLVNSLNEETSSGGNSAAERLKEFAKDVDHAVSKSGSIEELTTRIENLKAALANDVASGKIEDGSEAYFKRVAAIKRLVDMQDKLIAKEQEARYKNSPEYKAQIAAQEEQRRQLQLQAEEMKRAQQAQKEYEQSLKEQAEAIKRVKSAMEGLKKSFTGVLDPFKQFARIAKYRVFRTLLKEISEGFSLGLENVRKYSEAINGLYARDMKGLDDSLLKMKNSIGAATAQAILSVIPLFQTLTHWVIEAANAINQFFALMNGATTWTRAVDVDAEQFEDLKKSAGGAGKAMKNLLAAWDELNIIQSQSGGGGGGGGKQDLNDYSKMFEEVDVFDSKIRDLVTFVQENLDLIKLALGTILLQMAGMSLGAASLTMSVIISYDRGKQAGLDGKTWVQSLVDDLPNILMGGIGGLVLGAKFGITVGDPVAGAIIGLVAGVAVSLIANIIGWIEGNSIRRAAAIMELAKMMQDDFGKEYGVNVNLKAEVMNARVANVQEARKKVSDAAVELSDTYTVWLASSVRNDPNSLEGLRNSVKGVVDAVNKRNETEKNFILLTFGTQMEDGTYSLSELGQALSDGLDLDTAIITGIGKDIGKALADGTSAEYRNTVLPSMMDVLRQMVDATYRAQAKAKYDIEMSKGANTLFYEDANGNTVTDSERFSAYMLAHSMAVGNVREAAANTINEQITDAGEILGELVTYQANAEKFAGSETEKHVQEVLKTTGMTLEEAVQHYTDAYNELLENRSKLIDDKVREIIGNDSAYKMNVMKAIQMLYPAALGSVGTVATQNQALRMLAESGDSESAFLMQMLMSLGFGGQFGGIQAYVDESGKWKTRTSFEPGDERYEVYSKISEDINNLLESDILQIYLESLNDTLASFGLGGNTSQAVEEATKEAKSVEDELRRQIEAGKGVETKTLEEYLKERGGIATIEDLMGYVNGNDSFNPAAIAEFYADELIQMFLQDYLNRFPDAPFGETNGRRPSGTLMAGGVSMTSGVSFKSGTDYGAYVQADTVVVTGASMDDTDDDDPQTEETNRLLRNILEGVTNIRNKRFTAEIVANANTGRLMRTAISQAERVYGI